VRADAGSTTFLAGTLSLKEENEVRLARPLGSAAPAGIAIPVVLFFFLVRGNGVRFDSDLELSVCVQVGALDPAVAGGERAGVRRPLLPPQRDLGPQIVPLRSQGLLHSLHLR